MIAEWFTSLAFAGGSDNPKNASNGQWPVCLLANLQIHTYRAHFLTVWILLAQ